MRKIFSIIFLFFGLGFFFFVDAQTSFLEKIEDFSVEINLQKDSSFLIKESILYDFGQNFKHGIFRKIPLEKIKINFKGAKNEFGSKYPAKTTKESGYLKIKIGDPKKVVNGEKNYNIFYKVKNGILFFEDHDELYWNVTGNEWEVPINKARAIVYLPEKIAEGNLTIDCFTGRYALKEKNCYFKIEEGKRIFFESEKEFLPHEGLTIVLGIPKGIIKKPSIFLKILWELEDNGIFFLPPILSLFYLFLQWWLKGRDPKIKKSIIPQYEPPENLKPAEVNLILNQNIKPRDISATLIDLAVRGYLKIIEIEKTEIFGMIKDYEIEKLKEGENLEDYEKLLLERIFRGSNKIRISFLKHQFYYDLEEIVKKVCETITNKGYFSGNPQKVKNKYPKIGILLIILGAIMNIIFQTEFIIYSFLFSGILFFIFAPFMPKRTEKGKEALWHILGFRDYINTAEKYRSQFQEKENIFEKYLPYAIAFDLTDKWANAFEGIYKNPPSWYQASYGGSFSPCLFSKSLNSTISLLNTVSVAKPARGSGLGGRGFSGGGGSW